MATVVARSRQFHWVTVNRDRTPEIPKRFQVSAYPSLLVLGRGEENVFRFESFQPPEKFLPLLDEAQRRWDLYEAGQAWDAPARDDTPIRDALPVAALPAPNGKVPAGVVEIDGDLYFAAIDELFRLDARYGQVKASWPLDVKLQDIATDGKVIYAATSGVRSGEPILVLDPATGKVVREIAVDADPDRKSQDVRGLEWKDGQLWVISIMGKLEAIDAATGKVVRTLETKERYTFGLAFDGKRFAVGGHTAVYLVDPETGAVTNRIPVRRKLRAVGYALGDWWAMEQPAWGFDRRHERVQSWPLPGEAKLWRLATAGR